MSTAVLWMESKVKTPESPTQEGTCWRCGGTGEVEVTQGTLFGTGKTPCGACLGTKVPPNPCPKCESKLVKMSTDGSAYCMRCRDCGHTGPYALGDLEAYKRWQEET
jgi:hypothetical protein